MPKQNTVNSVPELLRDAVTCPFCSLLCDDLETVTRGTQVSVDAKACPKAHKAFAAATPAGSPLVDGQPVTLEQALSAAKRILKYARQPLFSGLATDVDGVRASLALAERCGAIVDHLHGASMAHGIRVLQSRGQTMTTLAEVRNRADVVVLLGADINEDFHRFAEICLTPAESLSPERLAARQIFHLGPRAQRPRQAGLNCQPIVCTADELPNFLGGLRALLRGRQHGLAGRSAKALAALAHTLKSAAYAVFVWAPGQLPPAHAEHLIGSAGELIAELNQHTRAAGLALGGNEGGQTALATAAWTTGYPLQFSYAGETLDYDPLRYQTARLLAEDAVDALVWISTFSAQVPPANTLPCIVIGNAASALTRPGSVYLPVGTPGIDHTGQLMRTDSVVSLPLQKLRGTGALSTAQMLAALAATLD